MTVHFRNLLSLAGGAGRPLPLPVLVVVVLVMGLPAFSGLAHAGATLQLENNQTCYSALQYMEILRDAQGNLTLDQVRSPEYASRFKNLTKDIAAVRVGPHVYWYRLYMRQANIHSDAMANTWVLSMKDALVLGDAQMFILHTGDDGAEHIEQRYMTEQMTWNFLSVPLENSSVHTIYLRIKAFEPIPFVLPVCGAQAYLARQQVSDRWLGLYFGIILTMALLNWFLFIFLRDRSYLWYVVYQGFLLTFVMLANNIIDIRIVLGWGADAQLVGALFYVSLSMLFFGAVQFSRHFLLTRQTVPKFDRTLHYLVWAILISTVAVPIFLFPVANSMLVRKILVISFWLLIPIFILITGVHVFKQGFRPARFFLVAWGLFALGALISGISIIGVFSKGSIALHGFEAGTALEAIVLSLALVDRMRILQEERKSLNRARQDAEATAKISEERLRFSLEVTGDGVWDLDIPSGRTYFSPECYRMLGYEPGEVILSLEEWGSLLHPDDFVKTRNLVAEAVAMQRSGWGLEVRARTKQGSWRWILVRAKIVEYDPNGRPLRMLGTQVDITERKLAEKRMFHADKMAALGQIMAGIAHEINNPNNFIAFNLPLLKEYIEAVQPVLDDHAGETPDWKVMKMPYDLFIADMYKMVEDMQYGSSRISGIVQELKTYIRSHEKEELSPQDVSAVLEHVKALASKQVQKMVRHFSVVQDDGLPPVMMNTGRIEQVLINLLINAAQAADKPDSRVSLTVRRKTGDPAVVQFIVEDNGAGIPEDVLSHIFDPFFTTKRHDAGTGLGLSISQRIVDEHNGNLSVTSVEGEGSVFTLELPVAPQES